MGITYAISAAALPADLDYIALGHVHRPQTIPGLSAPGRYAGSPMALDFSDEGLEPSACVVEIVGDQRTTTRLRAAHRRAGRWCGCAGRSSELGERARRRTRARGSPATVELDAPGDGPRARACATRCPDALRVEPVYPEAGAPEAGGGPGGGDATADLGGPLRRVAPACQGRTLTPAQAAAFAEALAAGGAGVETDDD